MWCRWAGVACWTIAILVGSLLPGKPARAVCVVGADKIAHFVMYAVLSGLVLFAVGRPGLRRAALVVAGCGALSAAVELAQCVVPGRGPSAYDAAAGVAGAAIASAAYVLIRARRTP